MTELSEMVVAIEANLRAADVPHAFGGALRSPTTSANHAERETST